MLLCAVWLEWPCYPLPTRRVLAHNNHKTSLETVLLHLKYDTFEVYIFNGFEIETTHNGQEENNQ